MKMLVQIADGNVQVSWHEELIWWRNGINMTGWKYKNRKYTHLYSGALPGCVAVFLGNTGSSVTS